MTFRVSIGGLPPNQVVTVDHQEMTIEDFIAARLADTEKVAQAACDSARADTEGDASRWFVDEEDGRESAGVTSGFPQRVVGRPGGANGVVVYDEGYPHVEQARHIALHDPAHVLRQCAAIRRMVAALVGHREGDQQWDRGINAAVASAAAIWRDHPDYNPEWERP
ncbi:DUF6221 family protein [Nocardia sp. NPDC004260]